MDALLRCIPESLLDYTMWRYLFEDGSGDAFLLVLCSYQNEDGGFGHNLECNNWNPRSSPCTYACLITT